MLFTQAVMIEKYDKNNPAVKESFDASSKIVDGIHEYGLSKGKYIYVGTWEQDLTTFDYPEPKLDFITSSPKYAEMENRKFDDNKWRNERQIVVQKFGNIPHFVFLDWGFSNSPLQIFSPTYSKEQQKEFLQYMTDYFKSKGMIVIYPVHGGELTITGKSSVLAYGKYNPYDSLAPEFDTYDTIKELAQKKARR